MWRIAGCNNHNSNFSIHRAVMSPLFKKELWRGHNSLTVAVTDFTLLDFCPLFLSPVE